MNAIDAIDSARENGWVELQEGVYLSTRDNIVAEQETWPEEDGLKTFDFSSAPYWITTDDGASPIQVYSNYDEELHEILGDDALSDHEIADEMVANGALDLDDPNERQVYDEMTSEY
jgi:hypothetical protein